MERPLLPRNKAGLIHYRRDWKALGSGVKDDQFDALYLKLIPTVWTVQADSVGGTVSSTQEVATQKGIVNFRTTDSRPAGPVKPIGP